MRNFRAWLIICGLIQSFVILQNSFWIVCMRGCVCVCVLEYMNVCEGRSIFVYANSPWTLVSMKIIKIGMACTVVYTPCYHYCAIVFLKAILNTV